MNGLFWEIGERTLPLHKNIDYTKLNMEFRNQAKHRYAFYTQNPVYPSWACLSQGVPPVDILPISEYFVPVLSFDTGEIHRIPLVTYFEYETEQTQKGLVVRRVATTNALVSVDMALMHKTNQYFESKGFEKYTAPRCRSKQFQITMNGKHIELTVIEYTGNTPPMTAYSAGATFINTPYSGPITVLCTQNPHQGKISRFVHRTCRVTYCGLVHVYVDLIQHMPFTTQLSNFSGTYPEYYEWCRQNDRLEYLEQELAVLQTQQQLTELEKQLAQSITKYLFAMKG